jgi:fructose-1-phosphate kinase PfkB-like protein
VGPEDVHRICDDIAALAHDGTIMVFTGSLPAGFPLAHYRDLIKRCRANRARIVIDAADEVAASLRDEQLWMVKLNSAELATFTERPTATRDQCIDAARACCSAHGGHVEIVIATRGADGAIMIGPETEIACRVSLNQERLATTIGCGDALLAGLLHEWLRAERWDHALRRGVAVATAVAVGRSPGTFSLEDAKAFWTHATIEPLA